MDQRRCQALAAGHAALVHLHWPATWHVVWYMQPTTVRPGSPSIDWDVAVERADPNSVTYWITVTNLATQPITFEGRYAVLN